MRKCPNGMLSEVKYDGERVQVHKSGNEFRYFSRSLKPVMPHKVDDYSTNSTVQLRFTIRFDVELSSLDAFPVQVALE